MTDKYWRLQATVPASIIIMSAKPIWQQDRQQKYTIPY